MTVYIPGLGKIKAKETVLSEIAFAFRKSAEGLRSMEGYENLSNHHLDVADAISTNVNIKREVEREC